MPDSSADFQLSQHIIYEDNYLLALNKPPGLSAEGPWGLAGKVSDYLKATYPWKKQLITGVVHRLDRPVSGLIVFAKTKMALKNLNEQFAKRSISKNYLAVCENRPAKTTGLLVHWLLKDKASRKALAVPPHTPEAKEARLKFQLLQQAGNHSLLAVELLTGRYHQIRAQLAAAGCPIANDVLYGGQADGQYPAGIYLHAHQLSFAHPKTGAPVQLEAPLPKTGKWNLFKPPL